MTNVVVVEGFCSSSDEQALNVAVMAIMAVTAEMLKRIFFILIIVLELYII